MDLDLVVFYLLAAVGVASALLVVTSRNLVHSALYLVVTFFSVAAIYVLLGAEFLAAVQVLVYAGGIMVLFLFVILLVDLPREVTARRWRRGHVGLAAALTLLVMGTLAFRLAAARAPSSGAVPAGGLDGGNIEAVAMTLFRYYLLPFEAVSLLLMVAMIGAILLARAKA